MLTTLQSGQTWFGGINGWETILFSNLSILTFTPCFISSAYRFCLYEGKWL